MNELRGEIERLAKAIADNKKGSPGGTYGAPPRPGRLAGGKQAGSAAGVQAVGDEIVHVVHNMARRAVRGTVGAVKAASRMARRATNWLDSLGGAGKTLAREIREVDAPAAKRENNNVLDAAQIVKGMGRSDRQKVAKSVNSLESVKDAPPFIKEAAKKLREVLDRDLNATIELNRKFAEQGQPTVQRRNQKGEKFDVKGGGKAFPQVPNAAGQDFLASAVKNGLADPKVYAVAEKMVEKGKAADLDDALAQIRDFQDSRMRGVNRYFERTRFELPEEFVEWDPNKVLPDLFHRNALFVEGIRKWGAELQRAKALAEQIGAENSDPNFAKQINEFIGHHFGVGGLTPKDVRAIAGLLSNYQTFTRLGFSLLSVLRNMGQRFGNLAYMPLSANVKATLQYPPLINKFIKSSRRLQEQMQRTGAVRSHTAIADVEARSPGETATQMALGPFQAAERGNQTYAALVAKYGIERDIAKLIELDKKGPVARMVDRILSLGQDTPAALKRRLQSSGLTDAQIESAMRSGKMSEQEMEAAMIKVVLDTQFALSIATERIWWNRSPMMRLMAKFKTFALDQTGFLWNRVAKEAFKGNFRPLVMTMLALIFVGELYNIGRDYFTGREEALTTLLLKRGGKVTADEVMARLVGNLADGGGLGIIQDVAYGVGDFIVGPMGTSGRNLARMGSDVIRRPSQWWDAIRDFASREISVTKQIDGAAARLERSFGKENNRLLEYAKWRQRSYEFKDDQKDTNWMQDYFLDVIEGVRRDFERTDRTLGYDYAARQITAGDVEDAADYLRSIFDNAKDRSAAERGMKISMRNKSPLGSVSAADREKFLSKFNASEKAEAIRLQNAWIADYERAIEMAKSRK